MTSDLQAMHDLCFLSAQNNRKSLDAISPLEEYDMQIIHSLNYLTVVSSSLGGAITEHCSLAVVL